MKKSYASLWKLTHVQVYGTCSLCYECEYNRLILTILLLCVWTLYISVSWDLRLFDTPVPANITKSHLKIVPIHFFFSFSSHWHHGQFCPIASGVFFKNFSTWMWLPNNEILTFTIPIFVTTYHPSVYQFHTRNTQFFSSWVLFMMVCLKYTQFM